MKKLILSAVVVAFVVTACGPGKEEKEAAQKENEEMVNKEVDKIMHTLDTSAAEATTSDSANVEEPSEGMEEAE